MSLFHRRKKKASKPLREIIDIAARAILADPLTGEPKVGAVKRVWVYKFTHKRLEYLVAYRLETRKRLLQLLAVGPMILRGALNRLHCCTASQVTSPFGKGGLRGIS